MTMKGFHQVVPWTTCSLGFHYLLDRLLERVEAGVQEISRNDKRRRDPEAVLTSAYRDHALLPGMVYDIVRGVSVLLLGLLVLDDLDAYHEAFASDIADNLVHVDPFLEPLEPVSALLDSVLAELLLLDHADRGQGGLTRPRGSRQGRAVRACGPIVDLRAPYRRSKG